MGYEKFSRTKEGRQRRGEYVTISTLGIFRVSLAAYENYFEGYKYVELFYNSEAKKVGLKLLKEATPDSYDIRVSGEKTKTVNITGKTFLNHYGIDYSKTRRYTPVQNKALGMIELDLNKPAQ